MADNAITVSKLDKDFLLPHERKNTLKEWVLHFKKPSYEKMVGLRDINFEVKQGEFFGIVGRNGSGKSTLLKIIGGIYQPTKGQVQVNGSLTPFIELGIGFNPELTGRENIFLNGAILGLTRREINKKYQEIVDFAELEKFMDQKLKNYSSGMQVRLAFSIAIQAHNSILLIDEVLAVGDAAFQRKCFEVFKSIKHSDKTVVFVSHDMSAVREYCDRAIMIEGGKVVSAGDPDQVANDYIQLFNNDTVTIDGGSQRWGGQQAVLENLDIKVTGKAVSLQVDLKAKQDITKPIMGLIIKDLDNHHLIESNNKWKKINLGNLASGESMRITWDVPNIFRTGKYKVSIAAVHEDGLTIFDWREDVASFNVTRKEETAGLVLPNDELSFKRK